MGGRAQDEGFVEAGGAEGSPPPWEVDGDRMWALGRCGSQLPTPHPPPHVCISQKNWI